MPAEDRKANAIYLAFKDDKAAEEQIRERYKAVAMEVAMGEDRMEVTSFTVNGQSAAGENSMTRGELLELLELVVWCFDNNSTISRRKVSQYFH